MFRSHKHNLAELTDGERNQHFFRVFLYREDCIIKKNECVYSSYGALYMPVFVLVLMSSKSQSLGFSDFERSQWQNANEKPIRKGQLISNFLSKISIVTYLGKKTSNE